MEKAFTLLALVCFISSCVLGPSATAPTGPPPFQVTEISDDTTYGYSEKNPVQVGGALESGPMNERFYLDQLRGPNGQKIYYERLGSCCHFPSESDFYGNGKVPLDMYKVAYMGIEEPVIIYINMYDLVEPKAPVGFTVTGSEMHSL